MIPPEPLHKLASSTGPFIRVAALSGAAAVILGAYGSHSMCSDSDCLEAFECFS